MKTDYSTFSVITAKAADLFLLSQPFLALLVFVSVIVHVPPLWVSWIIALLPFPIRYFRTGKIIYRTPLDIPIIILTAGMLLGFALSPDPGLAYSALNTYFACVLFYYGIISNTTAPRVYWAGFFLSLLRSFYFFQYWRFRGLMVRRFSSMPGYTICFPDSIFFQK